MRSAPVPSRIATIRMAVASEVEPARAFHRLLRPIAHANRPGRSGGCHHCCRPRRHIGPMGQPVVHNDHAHRRMGKHSPPPALASCRRFPHHAPGLSVPPAGRVPAACSGCPGSPVRPATRCSHCCVTVNVSLHTSSLSACMSPRLACWSWRQSRNASPCANAVHRHDSTGEVRQ
jgi:hypothetical protein